MELRDHPVFVIRNLGSWWPPVWVSMRRGHRKTLNGEVGVLVGTTLNGNLPNRLFIRIESDAEFFLGALVVSNEALCFQLHKLLQQYVGRTIEEIGDLDIDSLL